MHYPWWYVSGLTAPMLIAIVAVVHVIVSHYAVGGGILLALENRHALRTEDGFYRDYWKKHARFFVMLTVVFGAVTGVGIWWTIGLASPVATEMLIRTFVFGWAIEWCFFVLEIVAAFAFLYYWDKLPPRTHSTIGFLYAGAAWISLVLITGITAFMLNSQTLLGSVVADQSGEWTGSFWQAFLNEQFLPQTIIRTGGSLILATFYIYLHATLVEKNDEVRETVVRRMRIPSVIGIVLLLAGATAWYVFLSPSSKMMLERAAAMNIFLGLFVAIVMAMIFLIVVGPFRRPRSMSLGFAFALFLLGMAGVATGEFLREAVRKPFIVDQFIYGHQIYVSEVDAIRQKGLLESGIWTRMQLLKLQEKYPNLKIVTSAPVVRGATSTDTAGVPLRPLAQANTFQPASGHKKITNSTESGGLKVQTSSGTRNTSPTPPIDSSADAAKSVNAATESEHEPVAEKPLRKRSFPAARPISSGSIVQGNSDWLRIADEDRLALGRVIFMYHCNDCHAAKRGYSAAGPMMAGKSKDELVHFVENLNRPGFYMPPWCGTHVEAQLLADYLFTIRADMPENIAVKEEGKP